MITFNDHYDINYIIYFSPLPHNRHTTKNRYLSRHRSALRDVHTLYALRTMMQCLTTRLADS